METTDVDLRHLELSLAQYRKIGGTYPSEKQGLQALIVKPLSDPKPLRWIQTIQDLENDPWGTPYRYHYPGKQNPETPEIISAGSDKEFGTEDDQSNQD